MSRKLKDSEVYLRAAELQDERSGFYAFSCHTIQMAAGVYDKHVRYSPDDSHLTLKFEDVYLRDDPSSFSNGRRWKRGEDQQKDINNVRVLALLFMHEIAKDEERKRK